MALEEVTVSPFSTVVLKIIEELTDGLIILNQKREILFFNEALLRLTGWKSRDILTSESRFLDSLIQSEAEVQGRAVELPDSVGKIGHFIVSSFKIVGDEGFFFLVRVRPARQDEEATRFYFKEHYKILFNNIGDALLTVDLNGRIIAANPAFYKMVQFDQEGEIENIASLYVYLNVAKNL